MDKSLKTRLWIRIVQSLVNGLFKGTHFYGVKRKLLRTTGIKIGEGTQIVGPFNFDFSKIEIGKNCWIGKDFEINGHGIVIIGNEVGIAPHVRIYTGKHLMGPSNARHTGENVNTKVQVGNGAMVSAGASLVGTVVIGAGAVVMIDACVTKNVNENMMVGGVPAKVIKAIED